MAAIAITILAKIGEYLAAPVGRQFCYLFHLNSNIETLIDEVEKLKNLRVGIQRRVQAALNNVESIEPAVESWLVEAHKLVEEAQICIQDKAEVPNGCFQKWCLNLKPRYTFSRHAKNMTKDVTRLRENGQFGNISFPALIVPLLASTSTTRTFGTRKLILDEIVRNLKDDKVNVIGICGMGGVGKTTMAEEVWERVKEEKLFDDFAMVVIGQKQDLVKIQNDIAEMLGLSLHEQNPRLREAKLRKRLENNGALIILDDVWAEFDLKVLGITFREGFKVLFTSREQGLWRELKNKIDIPLNVLGIRESWDLFEAKVGDFLKSNLELEPVAKEIVKECGGLPLALVTVGSALIGKSPHLWRDTLRQLKIGYPSKVQGVSSKVYQSIELSYSFLDDEEVKSLFLLCCLFGEDNDIFVEDLMRMGLGLQLFRRVNGIEQARDRVLALVEELKCRYLLLRGRKRDTFNRLVINPNEYIRMHDVVRDVAKSIAAEKKGALILENGSQEIAWKEQCTDETISWIIIISKEMTKLPKYLRTSQVKFLKCSNSALQVTENFFDEMGELQVLDLYDMKYRQFPSLLRLPCTLRTLSLRKCILTNITSFTDLSNLEILNFEGSVIEELPIEIIRSANLVSLDLTRCYNLKIRAGIISRLCQLQELYIGESGIDWEGGENEEGENASIREFESLTNLHTLHIWIKDASTLPRSPLFSNLNKYKIQIGCQADFQSYDKCCSIFLPTFVPIKGDIDFLSKNSEELQLVGEYTKDLVHELVRDGSQRLKCLELRDIDTLEHVANTTRPSLFLTLESLSLQNLKNLKHISRNSLMSGSFGKLKELEVLQCTELRNVFALPIVTELVFLETLSIQDCDSMKEVIWGGREDDAIKYIVFPKLKFLEIVSLPRLISFCRGIYEIEFPQLKELRLIQLPQLGIPFSVMTNQSLFPPKVSFLSLEVIELYGLVHMKEIWSDQCVRNGNFCNLTRITVHCCDELRSVFSQFMAKYLVHLQHLIIRSCSLLEVVVAEDEKEDDRGNRDLFPALEFVVLEELPVLESFCHVAHDLEFKMLKTICIVKCTEMKTFSPEAVSTPNLNNVTVDFQGRTTLWVKNLNSTIMNLHQQKMI